MALETHVKATLPQRAIHETKEFVILAAYLYITLGAVIAMKNTTGHVEEKRGVGGLRGVIEIQEGFCFFKKASGAKILDAQGERICEIVQVCVVQITHTRS